MRKTGILLLFLSVGFAGCSSVEKSNVAGVSNTASDHYNAPLTETAQAGVADSKYASSANSASAPKRFRKTIGQAVVQQISLTKAENVEESSYDSDRKIIRNADLDLEADTPEESQRKITSVAETNGGFVVDSQQSSSDIKSTTRDIVTMSVRVPANKFSQTLDEIRRSASRVITETVKGEDVTEEFIDVEAQLKAKKALEAQFVEIMKRANTVQDALDVHGQLAEVRGEIEKIEGRKRFLENQASLSTVKVRIQAPSAISASSVGFDRRLTDAFSTGSDFALNFLMGLLTFVIAILPFAVLVGLPSFLIIRHGWKRHVRPRSVSEIAKYEISG